MRVISGRPDKVRQRRTQAEIKQLERQIIEVLAEDHPQSVRHVYYRMTDPRLPEPVEKTQRGYEQVQHRLTILRRSGRVPYDWITDSTRRGYHVATYADRADFIRTMAGAYRHDLWRESEHYVEVWCESRSIAGVIEDTCRDLAVSLYPAGGFPSMSLVYQAADYINADTGYGERPAEIIYIGDYDPAGVIIDKTTEREFRAHLDPRVTLRFYRLAITKDQIGKYDLPTKPRNENDRRERQITETVEAEAMPAHILRRLLRDTIEGFLPVGALEAVKAAEESERQGLIAIAEAMRTS